MKNRGLVESLSSLSLKQKALREKCPNMEFFLARIFPYSKWIPKDTPYFSVFAPNTEKYGSEKTTHLYKLLFCSSVNVKSNLIYLNYVIRWKHLYVGTGTKMYSSVSSISIFSLLLFSVACIRIDSNIVILHINGFVDLKH